MFLHEPQPQALSEQIYKHAQRVCCFDSDNTGNARLATVEMFKYIKALWFTLYMPTDKCAEKLALLESEVKKYKALMKNARVTTFILANGYGVFKPGDKMLCLSLDVLISREVLQFVNRVYSLSEKFNFGQRAVKDFYPYFGQLRRADIQFQIQQRGVTPKLQKELKEEKAFIDLYEKGMEFIGDNKQLFLRKTFKDVRNEGCYLGVGNCALMADVAFVEAIAQEHSYPITYLRFVCKEDPKVDVLNCIALGSWPDPGCVIIAPWLKNNGVFTWNGTIENTPRVTEVISRFNGYHVLCRLTPAEKEQAKSELKKMGYAQWLASETRTNNLSKIRESAETFLRNIKEVISEQQNKQIVSAKP